jgi:uncharacterized repeat protein (TIGR01451 family)
MITKTAMRAALISTALVSLGSYTMAAGTAPDTDITNSIDVSYSSGGTTITRTNESSVTFKVDRKVDFVLEGQDAGSKVTVSQDAPDQQLTFRLQNEGNDVSGYDIDIETSGTIGLTSGTGEGTYSVYISPNAGAYDANTDTAYDPSGTVSIGDIVSDGIVYIKIVADIPADAADGQEDTFKLTATALDANTSSPTKQATAPSISVVDTFFADGDEDGIEIDSERYQVSAPIISANKTSVVISENLSGTFNCATEAPDGGEAFVPGACVEYTLTISNGNATAPATNVVMTDVLPDDVTFVDIVSYTNFDNVSQENGTVTGSIASLPANTDATATFRVTID